jgi:replicative DNA helicase
MTDNEQNVGREVPKNVEAEQALLGALLTNQHTLEKVGDFLRPEHFSVPEHAKIYAACLDLIERGRVADPVTLHGYFSGNGMLDDIGGAAYLMQLATGAVTIINAADYGRQIFDRYLRRQLIDVGYDIVNNAFEIDLQKDAMDQIGLAEQQLFELAQNGRTSGELQPFSMALGEALKTVEHARLSPDGVSGLSVGIKAIDKKLTGLHPSDLIVLAGRPGMGKTALATCMAYNVARDFMEENKKNKEKKSVAFFSLEMSSSQLAGRILSTFTHINSEQMRSGMIKEEDFERLAAGVSEMSKLPLYIDDTPGLTVSAIRTRARRIKRDKDKGLGLVVIDYLQLISSSDIRNNENRVQVLSEITRSLKILAKELNVPVIALSQLSRQVESRDDKRPLLSDLRESGSIEQDADVVLFVFRESYYLENSKVVRQQKETDADFAARIAQHDKDKKDKECVAELIVAKQRHGSVGPVKLYFNGAFTEFGDLAP